MLTTKFFETKENFFFHFWAGEESESSTSRRLSCKQAVGRAPREEAQSLFFFDDYYLVPYEENFTQHEHGTTLKILSKFN